MAQNDRSAIITFENKLYQLLIAGLDGDRIGEASYRERLLGLARTGIGGFIIQGGVWEALIPFIGQLRSCAPAPLFFASPMDRGFPGQFPGLSAFAAAMGGAGGMNRPLAERTLLLMAYEAAQWGINMPLIDAPDAECGDAARAAVTEALFLYRRACLDMGLCVIEKRPAQSEGSHGVCDTAANGWATGLEPADPAQLTAAVTGDEPGCMAAQSIGEGADMLIEYGDPDATVVGLAVALRDGRLTEQQVDSAITRITRVKAGLSLPGTAPAGYVGKEGFSARVAQAAITLVKGRGRFIPVRDSDSIPLIYAGDEIYFTTSPLRYYVKQASHVSSPLATHERPVMFLLFPQKHGGNGSSAMEPAEVEAIHRLIRGNSPAIVVSFGSPYALAPFKGADVLIAAHGASADAQEAVFRCVTGESPFEGEFPVDFVASGRRRPRGPHVP